MDSELKKLSKKAKLDETEIKDIIVYNHLLNNMYKKKQLKEVELNFTDDSLKILENIASILKVNIDSLVCHALKNHLKLNGLLK